ncbi:MAG: polyphosphate kinase [Williamsia sp.]|nr:polyphosphate kinase [Williamsia sp.]
MSIKLQDISTRAPEHFDKKETREKTARILEELDGLQNLLFAESKHSLLIIFQGMDASGKDGAVKNVMGTLNPLGVKVRPFKAPTEEELAHDFLWRIHAHAPARGMIQVFNRSHYEDILITRVHKWCDDETAYKRMDAINNFERLLTDHNKTHILKFYLHISREEQSKRFEERRTDTAKHWKFNSNDYKEAELWDVYRQMYEDCFQHCNNPSWIVVPSDQNWYKEYTIASVLLDTLKGLNMKYPDLKK